MAPIIGIMASQISGHLWPANSYESISTVTVGAGGAASATFSSIPSTYTHLQIRFMGKETAAGSGVDAVLLTFNGWSSGYAYHNLLGNGTAASSSATTSATRIAFDAAPQTSNNGWGVGIIDILDYANTNKVKTIRTLTGYDANGSGNIFLNSGSNWTNNNAISSFTLTPQSGNWAQYSQFELYGIK